MKIFSLLCIAAMLAAPAHATPLGAPQKHMLERSMIESCMGTARADAAMRHKMAAVEEYCDCMARGISARLSKEDMEAIALAKGKNTPALEAAANKATALCRPAAKPAAKAPSM